MVDQGVVGDDQLDTRLPRPPGRLRRAVEADADARHVAFRLAPDEQADRVAVQRGLLRCQPPQDRQDVVEYQGQILLMGMIRKAAACLLPKRSRFPTRTRDWGFLHPLPANSLEIASENERTYALLA